MLTIRMKGEQPGSTVLRQNMEVRINNLIFKKFIENGFDDVPFINKKCDELTETICEEFNEGRWEALSEKYADKILKMIDEGKTIAKGKVVPLDEVIK